MFLLSIVIVFVSFSASQFFPSRSQEMPGSQAPGTCEEVVIELAKFEDTFSEWGTTVKGDPYRSTRHSSAGGEWFAEGITIYKSKSRFNKSVRQINKDVEGLAGRTALLDAKGQQIGMRVVKETRVDGKPSSVLIWLITDRMIQGISAPSLKLALTVEKANITCRAESERRSKSR